MDQFVSVLQQCGRSILQGMIALSIAFLLFSILERMVLLTVPRKSWRASLLDLQYALLSMLYPPFSYFIISAIFGFLALNVARPATDPGMSPLLLAGQLLLLLFVRDCLIYLRHRIFHTRPIWAFHSIHHSSEEVNWLSAARFHPAENLIETSLELLLFLSCAMIGFAPGVLATAGLLVGFYNYFIHSNLPWTFGPLRFLFVSPVFHRWHHSDAPEACDKNFAAMFSFIDLAFGTFYMPRNTMPETTGLSADEKMAHPQTLAGQLFYPFRKRKPDSPLEYRQAETGQGKQSAGRTPLDSNQPVSPE